MNNSIIFYDSISKLINPKDQEFSLKSLEQIILGDKTIDQELTSIIEKYLSSNSYNNIFIPLCFGKILSDFLGLRLACHIRCTPTINQNANIYLYSFAGMKELFSNQCFNVLKTKGVFLIDYDIDTILRYYNKEKRFLSKELLVHQISKLDLSIPLNYEDSHSIANEWAINRWSQAIGADDDDIEKISRIQNNNLFFKYLKTLYPVNYLDKITSEDLEIKHEGKPKIIYIDDEAEKGWFEIFCKILADENEIDFSHLDDEFNEKSKDDIIEISLNKIIREDVDLVILDLRLHRDDFENSSIENISGYQILKRIKKHNRGIQVIMFSATNKIWNLQALQDVGADGFIIKESFEKVNNSDSSGQHIKNFISALKSGINRIFLKKIYSELMPLLQTVELNSNKKPKNYRLGIHQGKLIGYLDYLKSADFLLYSNPNNLKYCFLQLILIIEDIIKFCYKDSINGNHYVELPSGEQKLCLDKSGHQIELKLKPLEKWRRFVVGDCIIESLIDEKLFNNQADRIPFNYRLNCVLYFVYGIDLESSSKFSDLYRLRSNSVAHFGGTKVKEVDILNSLELLKILIN